MFFFFNSYCCSQEYYKSGRMLVKLAEAIGRLVLAGRELTRLAGFTARVTELLTVLKDLNHGRYERTMVSTENGKLENVITILPNLTSKHHNFDIFDFKTPQF